MYILKCFMDIFTNASNWTLTNILSAISLILLAIGGFFALFQWISANKIKRTEFVNQIIEKLRFDPELVKTMYMIEYDCNWYNCSFHNGKSDTEEKIDKFLSYLSYICYIREMRILHKREFAILEYELHRTCSSSDIQSYLWNLYHFSKKQNVRCTYQYLISYGIEKKIIDKDSFLDENSIRYRKYLNF